MYYFAYGSNMDLSQMRRLCGWHCQMLGKGELEDFEIGMDLRGYANIRAKAGEKVFGVLYDLDQVSIEALDEFEGSPHIFMRKEFTVKDYSGNGYTAWVYFEPEDQFGGKQANISHWERIIANAKENHLPTEWIEKLESFV